MHMQPSRVTTEDIDRALDQRMFSFGFPKPIEALYRRDAIIEQRGVVALNTVLNVILFDLFVINDYFMLRESFSVFLIGKFLVVTPVSLLGALLVLRTERFYQPALLLCSATMSMTLAAMLYWSHGVYRSNYLFGILLIMVGAMALDRPRLPYAIAGILIQCACFAFVVLETDIVPRESWVVSLLFCMSAVVVAGLTAYALESVNRRAFLFKLRVQILNRDLQAMAVTDPLTKLGNRRALEEATQRHWGDETRVSSWVSMILIDVDFFKSFNDSYGHPAGDACLERIARAVQGELRGGGDLAVRFGGEEIAVFLPDTEMAQARRLAGAIRQAIAAAAIPHPVVGTDAVVTASLGVASCITGDCTSFDLVKYADLQLYSAKRAGRNQVWPLPVEEVAVDRGLSFPAIAGLAA